MADKYRVHGAHETTVPVEVKIKGVKAIAALPAMIVELVGTEPHQRSFTHVEVLDAPDTLAAARAKFRRDAVVVLTLELAPEEGDKA